LSFISNSGGPVFFDEEIWDGEDEENEEFPEEDLDENIEEDE